MTNQANDQLASPLVKELFGLVEEMILPRLAQQTGPMGLMAKHFFNGISGQLPSALQMLEADIPLQQEIMKQLTTRVDRLKPLMDVYFSEDFQGSHANFENPLQEPAEEKPSESYDPAAE